MAQLIVVYWRDIPAQVIVKRGRVTAKRQLTERFEKAIDRAAMRATPILPNGAAPRRWIAARISRPRPPPPPSGWRASMTRRG